MMAYVYIFILPSNNFPAYFYCSLAKDLKSNFKTSAFIGIAVSGTELI